MIRDKYHSGPAWSSLLAGLHPRQLVVLLLVNVLAFTAVSVLLSPLLGQQRPSEQPIDSSLAAALSQLQDNMKALQSQQEQQLQQSELGGGGVLSEAGGGAGTAEAGRPNAIVGMAANVHFDYLYHFVRSAREACRECVIVLYMPQKDVTERVQALLSFYRAEPFVYDSLLASYTAKQQSFHPSSTRWLMMHDRLQQMPAAQRYNALFLTDVRDTFFQSDPFTAILTEGDGLYVAMENGAVTIAQEGWNRGWVKDCFGEEMVARVGSRVVSCSGTTLGTWDAALHYLRLMADTIREREKCERNGVDQGVHNVIVHTGLMGSTAVHQVSNERGQIATVQSLPTLHRNEYGVVLNEAGEPVSVVHQIDRSKLLLAQLDRQYPLIPEGERNRKE